MKVILPLYILVTTAYGVEDCYVCGSADAVMANPDTYINNAPSGDSNHSCAEIQQEIQQKVAKDIFGCTSAVLYYETLLKADIDVVCGCPSGATTSGNSKSSASTIGFLAVMASIMGSAVWM